MYIDATLIAGQNRVVHRQDVSHNQQTRCWLAPEGRASAAESAAVGASLVQVQPAVSDAAFATQSTPKIRSVREWTQRTEPKRQCYNQNLLKHINRMRANSLSQRRTRFASGQAPIFCDRSFGRTAAFCYAVFVRKRSPKAWSLHKTRGRQGTVRPKTVAKEEKSLRMRFQL